MKKVRKLYCFVCFFLYHLPDCERNVNVVVINLPHIEILKAVFLQNVVSVYKTSHCRNSGDHNLDVENNSNETVTEYDVSSLLEYFIFLQCIMAI
jgi:hypothetical protein